MLRAPEVAEAFVEFHGADVAARPESGGGRPGGGGGGGGEEEEEEEEEEESHGRVSECKEDRIENGR